MTPTQIRHFLRDDDLSHAEQRHVLDLAAALKMDRYADRSLAGPQAVAVIFDKPTLRTQVSFTTGVAELGGYPLMVDGSLAQIGERESVADTARILGRQVSAIVWRTYAQSRLTEMAEAAGVPVVNALTDDFHPCQILADLLTIAEHRGDLPGRTLAYLGDGGNNMAHSYLLGGAVAGLHVRVAAPKGHQPSAAVLADADALARAHGGSVTVTDSPQDAVAGADAVATDTWVSMGMEAEKATRRGDQSPFAPYQVTQALMDLADPEAIFLHCLPAYRGHEVTAEVIDGPRSVVWDEAENRLHVQKALLSFLLDQAGRARAGGPGRG
ncbi:MAG: ornithine carbamoyltransferase [Austwickia sp.]|nr:ornithine carbamoyltransferase [Austwickia sp.]MBK8435684.1 ornithine carbamoyltransferase [Austwickia sp.]MBK9100747.1 ornithine carbamoyltransferase [Austwickia sp.]